MSKGQRYRNEKVWPQRNMYNKLFLWHMVFDYDPNTFVFVATATATGAM